MASAMHAPPAPGPYLQTVSGRWVNPFDPDPEQLDAGDIARALANQCRFGGHSRAFYSVAQHSVIVSRLVEERGGDAEDVFAALMHDASEAYLGDMPHPLKHRSPLGAAFKAAEEHLERAIRDRFAIRARRPRDQARRPRPARDGAAGLQRRDMGLAGARRRRAARPRAGGVAARPRGGGVRRALRRAGPRPATAAADGAVNAAEPRVCSPAMRRVPWWVWVSATPMGLGAWTPIIPGAALRRPLWIGLGVLWSVAAIAGWAAAIANDGGGGAGGLIILGWVGAIATTMAIRPTFARSTSSRFAREREAAEQRLRDREAARRIAAEEPRSRSSSAWVARTGPGAQSAGLVDVNNAPRAALQLLPGIDEAMAARILSLREELNGFRDVHDLGTVLELDGHAVERLREETVFLPR